MIRKCIILGLLLFATQACRRDETVQSLAVNGAAGHAGAGNLSVSLIDSVPYENEVGEGHAWHVRVTSPLGIDVLPGILTHYTPVMSGDSLVIGVVAEENANPGLFVFDVKRRKLRPRPHLEGWFQYQGPAIAPDGRHIIYLARQGDLFRGIVAQLPNGNVIYRGPLVSALETDVGVDRTEWRSATEFQMTIDLSFKIGGSVRMRGTLSPLKVVVDTLPPGHT
jgi:hypothetical protein